MSAISILPKQYADPRISRRKHALLLSRCTLRFPSTDLCITFSSFLNPNTSASRASPETLQHRRSSTPMDTNPSSINHALPALAHLTSQQQVILVAVNQASTRALNTDSHGHLPPLSINIPNSSSSDRSEISKAQILHTIPNRTSREIGTSHRLCTAPVFHILCFRLIVTWCNWTKLAISRARSITSTWHAWYGSTRQPLR